MGRGREAAGRACCCSAAPPLRPQRSGRIRWHTAKTWLNLAGKVGPDGVLRLTGSYPAPDGPDWGWQIHIAPEQAKITMHNVVPGQDPYQVVELLTGTPR